MTGILAAISGSAPNIVYAAGLYGPFGADTVPITASATNQSNIVYNWIGYYVPAVSGSTLFSVTATWSSSYNAGTQYSIGYLWLGDTAKSGYTSGNANVTANNNSASTNIFVTAGTYYAIRFQWNANVPLVYWPALGQFYSTSGSFSMSIAGSTTPTLYYNSVTNGF
jgi:hypothetical protein